MLFENRNGNWTNKNWTTNANEKRGAGAQERLKKALEEKKDLLLSIWDWTII